MTNCVEIFCVLFPISVDTRWRIWARQISILTRMSACSTQELETFPGKSQGCKVLCSKASFSLHLMEWYFRVSCWNYPRYLFLGVDFPTCFLRIPVTSYFSVYKYKCVQAPLKISMLVFYAANVKNKSDQKIFWNSVGMFLVLLTGYHDWCFHGYE